jgi:excisionase family DNA binding protein
MNVQTYTPKQLASVLGVTTQTLQDWERQGKIKAIKTKGGHRRYIYDVPKIHDEFKKPKRKFIYARVSSAKQKPDLQRQVDALQTQYPDFEVIQDVGSGINFKRRGLITLLENVLGGNVSHIVVAHKDRLTRFGFDMFQYLFTKFGVSFEVLSDNDVKEPITDLAKDLLSIVTVFTARYYGSRKYSLLKENKVLSQQRTKKTSKPVHWRSKVLLQQDSQSFEGKRGRRTTQKTSPETVGNAE